MSVKTCRRCGQELPLTAFNTSVSKYIVGGEVKAIHESLRHICKNCQHPKGWHLKYKKVNVDNFVDNLCVENLHSFK